MLSRVEVITAQGATLNLPLNDDEVINGIYVREIDGLDPVKATLVSSSFANQDGQQYNSSRRETRNITVKMGIEPDYATDEVADLRSLLYTYFMPKTQVTLRFHVSDLLYLDILGRIESFQAPLFTEDPVVDVSLICFDPDFYDPNPVLVSGTSTSGLNEFIIGYPGTVETGILVTLPSLAQPLSAFTIYHRPPSGILRTLDFSYPMVANDSLAISTVFGSKYVTLTRAGSNSSRLYSLSSQSYWIELEPGDNNLRVYAQGTAVPFTIQYTTRYGGL